MLENFMWKQRCNFIRPGWLGNKNTEMVAPIPYRRSEKHKNGNWYSAHVYTKQGSRLKKSNVGHFKLGNGRQNDSDPFLRGKKSFELCGSWYSNRSA